MLKNFLSDLSQQRLWLTAEALSVSSLEFGSDDEDDDSSYGSNSSSSSSSKDEEELPQRYSRRQRIASNNHLKAVTSEPALKSCLHQSRCSSSNLNLGGGGGFGNGNARWTSTNAAAKRAGLGLLNDTRIATGSSNNNKKTTRTLQDGIYPGKNIQSKGNLGPTIKALGLKATQVIDISVNVSVQTATSNHSRGGMQRRNNSNPSLRLSRRQAPNPAAAIGNATKVLDRSAPSHPTELKSEPELRRSSTDPNIYGGASPDRWATGGGRNKSHATPTEHCANARGLANSNSNPNIPSCRRSSSGLDVITKNLVLSSSNNNNINVSDEQQTRRANRRRNKTPPRTSIFCITPPPSLGLGRPISSSTPNLLSYKRNTTHPTVMQKSLNDRWSSSPKQDTTRSKYVLAGSKTSSDNHLLTGRVISTATARSSTVLSSRKLSSTSNLLSLSHDLPPTGNARWDSGFRQGRASTTTTHGSCNTSSPFRADVSPKKPRSSAPNLLSLAVSAVSSPEPQDHANARWSSSSPTPPTGRPMLGMELLIRTNNVSSTMTSRPLMNSRVNQRSILPPSSKYGASAPNLLNLRRPTSMPQTQGGGTGGFSNAQWATASASGRPKLSMDLLLGGIGRVDGVGVVPSSNDQPLLISRWNSTSAFNGNLPEKIMPSRTIKLRTGVSTKAKLGLDMLNSPALASVPSKLKSLTATNAAVNPTVSRQQRPTLSLSRRVGASAPNLLNMRRSTVPADKGFTNAQWTRRAAAQGKGCVEAILDGCSGGDGLTNSKRWSNGSSGNLSSMDQWSTRKRLPKRNKSRRKQGCDHHKQTHHAHNEDTTAIASEMVHSDERSLRKKKLDVSPPFPNTSQTSEPVHFPIVSKDAHAGGNQAGGIPTDSVPLLVKSFSTDDSANPQLALLQTMKEMVTETAADRNIDQATGEPLAPAALSLATVEINRCARLAFRRERNGGELVDEEAPFCDQPLENLGCSETIDEQCDESVDVVSMVHSHCEDTISISQDHQASLLEDKRGRDKRLKRPVRYSSGTSRSDSIDSIADEVIKELLDSKCISEECGSTTRRVSGPQKPQRRATVELDEDVLLAFSSQITSAEQIYDQSSMDGIQPSQVSNNGPHCNRMPVRRTSVDSVPHNYLLYFDVDSPPLEAARRSSACSNVSEITMPSMCSFSVPQGSGPCRRSKRDVNTAWKSSLLTSSFDASLTGAASATLEVMGTSKTTKKTFRATNSSTNIFGSITGDVLSTLAAESERTDEEEEEQPLKEQVQFIGQASGINPRSDVESPNEGCTSEHGTAKKEDSTLVNNLKESSCAQSLFEKGPPTRHNSGNMLAVSHNGAAACN